jgi:rubredoxin
MDRCCVRFTVKSIIFIKGKAVKYKSWLCEVCGYIYNEAAGEEDHGLAPGTRWEDVPDDWECPDCGAGKSDFEMTEI